MKRFIAIFMALCLAVPFAASAEDIGSYDTLKAYWALISASAQTPDLKPAFRLLTRVMDGEYVIDATEDPAARDERLSRALPLLCEITRLDLVEFAGHNRLPVAMVRHAYYKALANALDAEIRLNPTAEEQYRNLQIVLQLFLSVNEDEAGSKIKQKERDTIRQIITPHEISMFADAYSLPTGFVEFIIMNKTWHDDNWDDDDAWAEEYGWTLENWADDDDVIELLGEEYIVTPEDVIEYLTEQDIPGDDYEDSLGDNSADYNNSVDHDIGDYEDSVDDDIGDYDDSLDGDIGDYDDSVDGDIGDYDDSVDGDIGDYDDSVDDDYEDSVDDDIGDYDDSVDYNIGDYDDSVDYYGGEYDDSVDHDDYDDSADDDDDYDDYDDSADDDYDDSIDDED